MPGDDPENLVATGFLRLGVYEYNQRDARGHWNDIMNELTDVTADVFLGLGMAPTYQNGSPNRKCVLPGL